MSTSLRPTTLRWTLACPARPTLDSGTEPRRISFCSSTVRPATFPTAQTFSQPTLLWAWTLGPRLVRWWIRTSVRYSRRLVQPTFWAPTRWARVTSPIGPPPTRWASARSWIATWPPKPWLCSTAPVWRSIRTFVAL